MLKVFKNEWRDHFRYVKLTLIAGLVMSVVMGIIVNAAGFVEDDMDMVIAIGFFVWFGLMTALAVMTIIRMVESMTKQMYGPEGYFSHMLPISARELAAGKALGNWVFGVFMVAYAALAVFLVGGVATVCSGEMGETLKTIWSMAVRLNAWHYGIMIQALLIFLVASACWVLAFQFIFEVSHQFGKFSLLGGVIAFWAVNGVFTKLGRVSIILGYAIVGAACYFGTVYLEEKHLSVG